MPFTLDVWILPGLMLASAMLWMLYVQSKDRHQPEPRRRLLAAFALGIVACGLSILGFSAIWGYGIAHAHFSVARRSHRALWQAGAIVLSMLVHGLYDFLIFAYQATVATSGLALAVWAFVVYRARHLANHAR